jgi:CheY-like chemotaxis protein
VNPLNILHVDDNESIRELTALSFTLAGDGAVRSAASGAAALDVLSSGYRPDLFLLDVMMPELDGPGLLTLIRALDGCADKPVIFMTAQTQQSELERLIGLGAAGVIVKPFDPLTLSGTVRTLLAKAPS